MQCHVIILDTAGTTYTIYDIEKRKETTKEKTNKVDKYTRMTKASHVQATQKTSQVFSQRQTSKLAQNDELNYQYYHFAESACCWLRFHLVASFFSRATTWVTWNTKDESHAVSQRQILRVPSRGLGNHLFWLYGCLVYVYMCVFFTLNRSFYPSTSSTSILGPTLNEMWRSLGYNQVPGYIRRPSDVNISGFIYLVCMIPAASNVCVLHTISFFPPVDITAHLLIVSVPTRHARERRVCSSR